MNTTNYLAAAAALAVAFWPQISAYLKTFLAKRETPAAGDLDTPSYQTAIEDLASVRLRLLKTECLGDAQKQAVDTLTLALVSGSDK